MSQFIAKAIPNSILSIYEPLTYKGIQHIITKDNVWVMLERILK